MAITAELQFAGVNVQLFEITATDDNDQVIIVPHGLQAVPIALLTPTESQAYVSRWFVDDTTPTSITLRKVQAAGSASNVPQVDLLVMAFNARALG